MKEKFEYTVYLTEFLSTFNNFIQIKYEGICRTGGISHDCSFLTGRLLRRFTDDFSDKFPDDSGISDEFY